MRKTNSIPISTTPASHTIAHPAVATVHLLNQLPGVKTVGGVTLYFEPVGLPLIELMLSNNVDHSYSNVVAQGIQQGLEHFTPKITGVRIWWCDWLWHLINSCPKACVQAAKRAITEIFPWLELTDFIASSSATTPSPPTTVLKQNLSAGLKSPSSSLWTLQTPLTSHITRISSTHVVANQQRFQKIGRPSITQATLAFKAIARTQRVCPIDKTPDFRTENREIFNAFADTIRRDLLNARGFDVIVHGLTHQTAGPTNRQTHCLNALNSALQQAINISSKH